MSFTDTETTGELRNWHYFVYQLKTSAVFRWTVIANCLAILAYCWAFWIAWRDNRALPVDAHRKASGLALALVGLVLLGIGNLRSGGLILIIGGVLMQPRGIVQIVSGVVALVQGVIFASIFGRILKCRMCGRRLENMSVPECPRCGCPDPSLIAAQSRGTVPKDEA